MGQINEKIIDNYDSENIQAVRGLLENEEKEGVVNKMAYTMLQKYSPCDVEITENSRKKCAKAIA